MNLWLTGVQTGHKVEGVRGIRAAFDHLNDQRYPLALSKRVWESVRDGEPVEIANGLETPEQAAAVTGLLDERGSGTLTYELTEADQPTPPEEPDEPLEDEPEEPEGDVSYEVSQSAAILLRAHDGNYQGALVTAHLLALAHDPQHWVEVKGFLALTFPPIQADEL